MTQTYYYYHDNRVLQSIAR